MASNGSSARERRPARARARVVRGRLPLGAAGPTEPAAAAGEREARPRLPARGQASVVGRALASRAAGGQSGAHPRSCAQRPAGREPRRPARPPARREGAGAPPRRAGRAARSSVGCAAVPAAQLLRQARAVPAPRRRLRHAQSGGLNSAALPCGSRGAEAGSRCRAAGQAGARPAPWTPSDASDPTASRRRRCARSGGGREAERRRDGHPQRRAACCGIGAEAQRRRRAVAQRGRRRMPPARRLGEQEEGAASVRRRGGRLRPARRGEQLSAFTSQPSAAAQTAEARAGG